MRFLKNHWFLLVLRVLLGVVFIYAGILKLGNPLAFADSIASFQMLPGLAISLFALAMPPFEVIAGILLIIGRWSRPASFCIAVLCVIFGVALLQALLRGLEVDCGCFGSGEPSTFKMGMSLGRDLLLLAGAAWIYTTGSKTGPTTALQKK